MKIAVVTMCLCLSSYAAKAGTLFEAGYSDTAVVHQTQAQLAIRITVDNSDPLAVKVSVKNNFDQDSRIRNLILTSTILKESGVDSFALDSKLRLKPCTNENEFDVEIAGLGFWPSYKKLGRIDITQVDGNGIVQVTDTTAFSLQLTRQGVFGRNGDTYAVKMNVDKTLIRFPLLFRIDSTNQSQNGWVRKELNYPKEWLARLIGE